MTKIQIKKTTPNARASLIQNETGQGLTEYLILLILVSVGSIAIVTQLGGAIDNRLKAAKEKIQSISVNRDRR